MGAVGAMNRTLKTPANAGTKFQVYKKDSVAELMDARQNYVRNTGRADLQSVEQTDMWKKLSEEEKRRYYKLNPKERPMVDQEYTLGKKSLLGS